MLNQYLNNTTSLLRAVLFVILQLVDQLITIKYVPTIIPLICKI